MTARVVVTGMGLVSPLGVGAELAWARLTAGRSGLRRLDDAMTEDIPCKVAGVAPSLEEDSEGGFDLDRYVPRKDEKKMDRFIQFALAAAEEAIAQAPRPRPARPASSPSVTAPG
jgi:3-oxoacyl-[acyl-carrier-protein] synthase II